MDPKNSLNTLDEAKEIAAITARKMTPVERAETAKRLVTSDFNQMRSVGWEMRRALRIDGFNVFTGKPTNYK